MLESDQKQEGQIWWNIETALHEGPQLPSFSFMGTLRSIAWHKEFKQKAAVMGWGIRDQSLGLLEWLDAGVENPRKVGTTKGYAPKSATNAP